MFTLDWEPDYDRGTGVYETKHEPPKYVFYKEDEHGRQVLRGAAHDSREAAEAEMFENIDWHRRHWEDQAKRAESDPNVVVIDGVFYVVGPPRSDREFSGFGGREFHILKNDGTAIETRNLWCGGEIPAEFRELIPDNAEFVNGEHWVEYNGIRYMTAGRS